MTKPVSQLLAEIKEAGLIYDPFVTASIISYEAGHFLRNCFYASMVGESDSEQQLKAGWLANARVELSDLLTQTRVVAAVYGWDWQELIETGEAKLQERINTYVARGVRPNEALLKSMQLGINARPAARPQPRRLDGD